VTISDLAFADFTATAPPTNLELELGDDGLVTATDDQTIAVAAPTLASIADQTFLTGDSPVPVSPITITEDATAASITADTDLRLRIPAGFPMTWDLADSVATLAGSALAKVGTAEQGRALIPLLADESSQVRNRAIEAIGILRVTDAGPALRELYEQHKRRALGTRVLSAMTLTSDPSQADLYRELLGSTDPERRRMAVEGLARVSDPALLPGFKKDFQREGNADVQLAYNFAIALLGDRLGVVLGVDRPLVLAPRQGLQVGRQGLTDQGPQIVGIDLG